MFAELNLAYLQRHGFNTPILFKEKTGLGLQVPSQTFTVSDVRTCVGEYFFTFLDYFLLHTTAQGHDSGLEIFFSGSRRILDVMDVATQKNSEMTMKEWEKYYNDPRKDRLLNVISLEFSHTRLENYVKRPNIVSINL